MDTNFLNSSLNNDTFFAKTKKIKSILRQFDNGEKRQWPNYLSDLSKIFETYNFNLNQNDKFLNLFNECERVFNKVLTTKLFPDIIQEIIICLTSFSSSLGHNCNLLFNWMFIKYDSFNSDDTKAIILKTIVKIIDKNHRGLTENLSLLINKTKREFEKVNTSELMIIFIEIFLATAKICPDIMVCHFQKIVDIIISWHVNSTHPFSNSISSNLSRALIGFKTFWVNEIEYSASLLNQFVDYYQNCCDKIINKEKFFNSSVQEKLEIMTSLVKIYLTVLTSLNQSIKLDKVLIKWYFIIESLKKFIKSVIDLTAIFKIYEPLVIVINDCALYVLNTLLQNNQTKYLSCLSSDLFNYLNFIFSLKFNLDELYNISTIKLATKLIIAMDKNLPIEFIDTLLRPNSNFQQLRFLPSKQILISYNELVHSLLNLKNIPLLEKTYNCLLLDLQSNLSILLETELILIEKSEKYENSNKISFDLQYIKLFVISDLISLSYFCNSKHSIIQMWALKPTFFELFIDNLQLTCDILSKKYPDIQYLILYILYTFCSNHQNYISTSNIMKLNKETSTSFNSSFSIVAPSSDYLSKILKVIQNLLKKKNLSHKSIYLCLNWFKEIVSSSKEYLYLLCRNDLFYQTLDSIIEYSYNKKSDICIECYEIMQLLINNNLYHTSFSSSSMSLIFKNEDQILYKQSLKSQTIKQIYNACLFHLTNSNLELRNFYLKLLSYLPLKSIMIDIENENEKLLFNELNRTKKLIMKNEPSNLFNSNCFKTLMSTLINTEYIKDDLNWLKAIFHLHYNFNLDLNPNIKNAQDQAKNKKENFVNTIDLNSDTLFFWACWELTQFCILNKLRTPYGKPQETFIKIENMIRQNASFSVQSYKEIDNLEFDSFDNQKKFQVKLLLQLMENLEKLIYNAYNSSSSMLFKTPTVSKTFFTTNKNTCTEWLNRNRVYLMMIGLKSDNPGVVWRNGELLLSNSSLHKNVPVENILVILTQALINLNEYDYIIGLQKWCLKKLDTNYSWMNGAIEESKGKLEDALKIYLNIFETNYPIDRKDEFVKQIIYQFLIKRITECYLNLGKNQEVLEFVQKYNSKELNGLFSINFNLEYIRWFDDIYDLTPNWNTYSYEKAETLLNWDCTQIQHQVEKKLIFSANSLLTEGVNLKTIDTIREVHQLTSKTLNFTMQCLPNKLNTRFIILQKIAQFIKSLSEKDQQQNLVRNILNFSDLEDIKNVDCSTLIFCIKWLNVLEKLRCKNKLVHENNLVTPFAKLHFLIAKSARKQGNLETASKYLLNYATAVCDIKNNFEEFNLKEILTSKLNKDMRNEFLDLQYEAVKLLHTLNDTESSVELMFNFISKSYVNLDSLSSEAKELWSKSILKLVKYSQLDQNNLNNVFIENSSNLSKLLESVNEPYITANSNAIKQNDLLIGKFIYLSTLACPNLAKTWIKLGGWSYRWARKLIDENEKKSENDKLFEYGEGLYGFYKLAAKSYFKFLSLRQNDYEDTNVTATLRLLKLIVRHSPILKEILEEGLKTTPINPWKTVILQLFARLGHPEPYVRQTILNLLCRIGEMSPHLIVFPAVANSVLNENVKFKLDEKFIELSENDFEDFGSDDKELKYSKNLSKVNKMYNNSISNCHKTLLSSQDPILVQQTTVFIKELKRIILLWNELWIGTLMNHLSEMKKQVNIMEHEVLKINKNQDLTKEQRDNLLLERHNLIFKKIIFSLESTQEITSQSPHTPHEYWFQKTFSSLITNVIKLMRNPEDASKPSQTLDVYYNLIFSLQKKTYQMNEGRSQFAMHTISSTLSSMENTIIPVPGANSYNQKNIVTIEKVYNTVVTLHTKTKPKKIAFYGSDGKLYTFLFKGEEDLHLDERIMQILSVINKMFTKSYKNQTHKVLYKARNYSVTPIGSKSGLIQWVDGTALYGIYRKWLVSKEQSLITSSSQKIIDNTNLNHRPSEKFNQKLIEKGLTSKNKSLSNKSWPIDKLIEIHQELVNETPCDLISKELWCSSTNAYEYWQLTQNFIHTNAAMCMIGYIIGLGDRHLDNVLVDFSSGELIHIDYNICFEKGAYLRVPEKVPCRLTNNIVHAFGLTKLEGTFRLSCENVLRLLRKERETLLTLLEAFLYDPLFFDWAPDNSSSNQSAQMKNNSNWFFVWKRIKLKLDGRDGCTTRAEIEEQVDFILNEATKVKNLALMYEGWTSWV